MSHNIPPLKTDFEKKKEEEKLTEIVILLSQLFEREEATAKKIIECLYDIATINLVNKYILLMPLNRLLKLLIKLPKSLAKNLAFALYVQPKCPKLITDWLFTLVEFSNNKTINNIEDIIPSNLLLDIEKKEQTIKSLQLKIKVLTSILMIAFIVFGSNLILKRVNYNFNLPKKSPDFYFKKYN